MPPRKIIFASTVAIIFIVFSVVMVNKQSVSVTQAEDGILVSSGDNVAYTNGSITDSSTSSASTNQTDILSKQVFSNFMVLRQSGNLNDTSIQSLADQLSSQIIASRQANKIYTVADLRVTSNATETELKNYGNEFFLLRIKYQNAFIGAIIAPDSPLIDTTDAGPINTYALLGNLYAWITADLLKMTVPDKLVSLHLEILNNYSGSAYGLKQFGQLETDPIAALSGLRLYGANSDQEELIIGKIAAYFVQNGIIFSASDPGYGWNNI